MINYGTWRPSLCGNYGIPQLGGSYDISLTHQFMALISQDWPYISQVKKLWSYWSFGLPDLTAWIYWIHCRDSPFLVGFPTFFFDVACLFSIHIAYEKLGGCDTCLNGEIRNRDASTSPRSALWRWIKWHFVRAFVWTCAPPGTELEPDLYYFSIQLLQLLSRNHMESLIPYPIDHLSTSLAHPGGNSCARELAFGGARASGSQNARWRSMNITNISPMLVNVSDYKDM